MLRLSHVTVRRQGKDILKDVSVTIPQDQHTAILGPNGSGKSTLIQVISKEIHPVYDPAMVISILGKERWNVFELRKHFGIVSNALQELCNRSYAVHEVIVSGFFSSIGIDRNHEVTPEMQELVRTVAENLQVSHLMHQRMNRLSSGEARRVLIARALINGPSTLILDEAVNSLDLRSQYQFKSIIRDIAQRGTQIILVTHDLADIIPEIEHVIIMKQGTIFGYGRKEDLLTERILSEVYDTPVYVDHRDGWFKAWC